MTTDEARTRPDEGRITEQKIDWLRQRIGIPLANQPLPSHEFATVDSIRNFARGIGDTNPLYRDTEYARASHWGKAIAPPVFMLYTGVGDSREYTAEERERGMHRGDPLSGVHGFYSAEEMEWFRHIEEGDRLTVRGGLAKVDLKSSQMGGQAVHATNERVYRNQRDELVGVARQLVVRVERAQSRTRRKYLDLDVPHHYSDDELAAIEADYEAEHIQGVTPRYWEDVHVGDEAQPLVKGPWTITAYICYCEATGPRNDFHRAHSDAYRYRKAHPRAWPRTDYGLPDSVARVHWEPDMARQAGLPHTYDMGGERVAMMAHFATNWVGDHGFVRRLRVEIRNFFFYGDTMWIRGRISDKRVENGEHLVEQEIWGENQRGEVTTRGSVTYILPSRTGGPVTLPAHVPNDISIFA